MAARGQAGGAMAKVQLQLAEKSARQRCEALANIYTELLTRKYGRLTTEHVNYICGKVDAVVAGSRTAVLPNIPRENQAAVLNDLAQRLNCLPSCIRRDLEIMRREQDALPPLPTTGAGVTNIYHLHDNSRVNIQSTDVSVNNIDLADAEVFARLAETISAAIQEVPIRQPILDRLKALEEANGKPTFAQRYSEFISAAADYMTLIYPFVPALTELLHKTLR